MSISIYGPYKHPKTGRQIVIIYHGNGKRETISYPKFLMELYLGRKLHKDKETVDHMDSNFDNNRLDNFRVMPRHEHSAEDTRRVRESEFTCIFCNKKFNRLPRIVRDKAKQGKSGPFCGRSCAGKYGRMKQLNLIQEMAKQQHVPSVYYKRKYEPEEILVEVSETQE